MFGHPHACRSARLTDVRCFAISAFDGINHSRVFLRVTWILEAVLKRQFPLARSSYDADAERTKNALDSLRGFVNERYHDRCGIRVVPFAKTDSCFPFLPRRRASSLSMNVPGYPFFSLACSWQRPALRSARCYRRRQRVFQTKERWLGGAAFRTDGVMWIERQVPPSVCRFPVNQSGNTVAVASDCGVQVRESAVGLDLHGKYRCVRNVFLVVFFLLFSFFSLWSRSFSLMITCTFLLSNRCS